MRIFRILAFGIGSEAEIMARRGGVRLMRTSLQSAGRWCHQAASWRHSTSAALIGLF